MDLNKKLRKIDIGRIGQTFLMYQLAIKGIHTIQLNNFFDYDILTSNNKRIEVKTSAIHKEKINNHFRDYYTFKVTNRYNSFLYKGFDFFCFICLNEQFKVEKYFFVPKDAINVREIISVPRFNKKDIKQKFSLKKYQNNISIIIDSKDKQNN